MLLILFGSVEYPIASSTKALLNDFFLLPNSLLSSFHTARHCADACTTLGRIRAAIDDRANSTTHNSTAYNPAGDFLSLPHLRGVLLALVLIDSVLGHVNTLAIDKAECEQYAAEVKQGEKVARGVIGGAVVGGAIGAIVNRGSNSAERGAGVGAVTGGVRGTQEGIREQEKVVKQCLRGRGYRVLN